MSGRGFRCFTVQPYGLPTRNFYYGLLDEDDEYELRQRIENYIASVAPAFTGLPLNIEEISFAKYLQLEDDEDWEDGNLLF